MNIKNGVDSGQAERFRGVRKLQVNKMGGAG
jgi:hypothetical protein